MSRTKSGTQVNLLVSSLFKFYPIFSLLISNVLGIETQKSSEFLDKEGNFFLSWEAEFSTKIIEFEVSVRTKGYVGLGLSVKGGMRDADIVIAGIMPDGTPYIGDFHGIGNTTPMRDDHDDWTLLSASENGTHTNLRFFRKFQTCDSQDVPITNDTMNVIWSYGETDDLVYHAKRGSYVANLLDLVTIPSESEYFKKWDIVVNTVMPSTSFAYWCTIHKSPHFREKNHIVGFKPFVKTETAIRHTHHFVIYRCEGGSDVFERFVNDEGGMCYGERESREKPFKLCKLILYDWGAGGRDLYIPDHLGFPAGEKEEEYYMLEVHYNNPTLLANVQFKTGVEVIYTPKLRKYDAGMMTAGHTVVGSLLIPPNTKDFQIVGHCSSGCTSRGIPKEGIKIFNVLLHTHLAGRKMKLRHFRGKEELPWISKDDSYHFNFQKNRPLHEERVILPGDQLTFECTYDTTGRDNVTIAGFSTANEMCEVFIWYYPKIKMSSCNSFYDITRLFQPFGIRKVEWPKGFNKDSQPNIIEPFEMRNKSFAEYLDLTADWSEEKKKVLQNELHWAPHISSCDAPPPPEPKLPFINREIESNRLDGVENSQSQHVANGLEEQRMMAQPVPELVTYPFMVPEYREINECHSVHRLPFMK